MRRAVRAEGQRTGITRNPRHRRLDEAARCASAGFGVLELEQRVLLSASVHSAAVGGGGGGGLPSGAITGTVFYDNNNAATNGTQGVLITPPDDGIPYIEVDLEQPGGTLIERTITNATGTYRFDNLAAQQYQLVVILPPGYEVGPPGTSPNQFVNNIFAQKTNNAFFTSDGHTAQAGENCGLFLTAGTALPAIAGTVWDDANGDGIFQNTETGLSGVTVDLVDASTNTVVASVVSSSANATQNGPASVFSFTAANNNGTTTNTTNPFGGTQTAGQYAFINIPLGNYYVHFDLGTDETFYSPQAVDQSPTNYSWPDSTTGNSPVITVLHDTGQTDVDCGEYSLAADISDPLNGITVPDDGVNGRDTNTYLGIDRPTSGTVNAIFEVDIVPPINLTTVDIPYTTFVPAVSALIPFPAVPNVDYVPTSGVLVFPPGVTSQRLSVAIIGNTTPENNVVFGVNITPPVSFHNNIVNAFCTIIDTAVPIATVSSTTVARPASGTANAIFTISLNAPAPFTVLVPYSTADFSALAGTDYQVTDGVAFFPPNTLNEQVSVPVLASTAPTNNNRQFNLYISSSTTETVGTPAFGTATILTNVNPILTASAGSVTESLIGLSYLPFFINVTPSQAFPIVVSYSTSDGTAVAGTDYAPTSGTVTLAPGTSQFVVDVPVYRQFLTAQSKTVNFTITSTDAHVVTSTTPTPVPTSDVVTLTDATAAGTINYPGTVVVPLPASHRLTYTDYLKNPVTVTLKGPGTASLVFLGTTSVATNAYEVLLSDTTPASTLTISTRRNLQTSFINMLDDSSMGSIIARSTNLLGEMNIAGSLNSLTLDYLQGAFITVGPGTGTLTLNFGRAVDTGITSAIPIKSLTAVSYVATTSTPAIITAPSVGPIRVKQGFGGTVVQSQSVASIVVGGAMTDTEILTTESIGPVSAGSMSGSTLYAGVNAAAASPTALPEIGDFETTSASIASVHVRPGGFSDSRIASWKIGTVNLGVVDAVDDGATFGVAADSIASVLGTDGSPIRLLKLTSKTSALVDEDFAIEAV